MVESHEPRHKHKLLQNPQKSAFHMFRESDNKLGKTVTKYQRSLWSLWHICPSSNSASVFLGKTVYLKNVSIQWIHWTSSKTVVGAVWWSLWTGEVFCLGSAPGTPLSNPHVETAFLGKVGLLHAVSWLCLVWWYRCREMWSLGCQWWECSLYSHTMPIKKTKWSQCESRWWYFNT